MSAPLALAERFGELTEALLEACHAVYAKRLVSLAVFGSVGRGTPRPDSDLDVLLVVEPLPDGRMARVEEFEAVERQMSEAFAAAAQHGVRTRLSPVVKTPDEVGLGSPLFLDLVEDADVLFDRDAFLAAELDRLRRRLAELGARRIWRGNAWFWDLKPDYRPGDEFEL
ncbi:MAG: nucleotidyltransferase domain-containing protein [Thermoanaerobaculia bacterium]